ncbi:hypothetical protein [Photobacterium nomapromontoriensis]|uniref:hypothetical protein n=1 Tax=Photobacterium nomapromontoriensis TaxID=2910237 RepID=UPI003D12C2F7
MILKTILGSFLYVKSYKKALFQATLLPIAISLFLELSASSINSSWVAFASNILIYVLYSIVAVNVHNIVINGPDSVPKWGRFKIGAIELRFMGHGLLLSIMFLVAATLGSLLGYAVIFLLIITGIIACRLSLVFPAIAIGKEVSFPYAWELTSGKTLYVFCVVALFPVALGLILWPLQIMGVPQVVMSMLGFLVTIITMTSLSLAHKLLTDDQPSEYR